MAKENDKKNKSILDESVWEEAAEMMERNQKSQMPDSQVSNERKENGKEDESLLGKIEDWFK